MNLIDIPQKYVFDTIESYSSYTVCDYISRLSSVPQGHVWHPEGNVLVHTKIVVNRAIKTKNPNIILAAFYHDLGKVDTTTPNDNGGYSAHNHEVISSEIVDYSRDVIRHFGGDPNVVHWLVKNHMRVKYLDEMTPKKRKNLVDHIWFPQLLEFKPCDQMGSLTITEVIRARGNPFMFLYNKYIR